MANPEATEAWRHSPLHAWLVEPSIATLVTSAVIAATTALVNIASRWCAWQRMTDVVEYLRLARGRNDDGQGLLHGGLRSTLEAPSQPTETAGDRLTRCGNPRRIGSSGNHVQRRRPRRAAVMKTAAGPCSGRGSGRLSEHLDEEVIPDLEVHVACLGGEHVALVREDLTDDGGAAILPSPNSVSKAILLCTTILEI